MHICYTLDFRFLEVDPNFFCYYNVRRQSDITPEKILETKVLKKALVKLPKPQMQIHSDYDIIKTIFSLRSDTLKKIPINLILYTAMFLIAGLLVISASRQSHQAVMSIPIPVHFTGEYSQSGGEWQMLDTETDLSSYNGAAWQI